MIYVTSDLHGCKIETLLALLEKAGFSQKDDLFVLGDVIDRGEHGVALLRWMAEQSNVHMILGNHEAMLLACRFILDPVNEESLMKLNEEKLKLLERWQRNGAYPTMDALRKLLKQAPDVVEGLLDYLCDAPLYEILRIGEKKYILVHAGLGNFDPHKPLWQYAPEELIWTRPALTDRYYTDATVVFGHTPTEYLDPAMQGRAIKTDSWICIDTGAACGNTPMLLRLNDEKEFYL